MRVLLYIYFDFSSPENPLKSRNRSNLLIINVLTYERLYERLCFWQKIVHKSTSEIFLSSKNVKYVEKIKKKIKKVEKRNILKSQFSDMTTKLAHTPEALVKW